MGWNVACFLTGLLIGGGGVFWLVHRDWQEAKLLAREMQRRLTEWDQQSARDAKGQ